MARLRCLALLIALTGCADLGPPANFLRTDYRPLSEWFDTKVDVDLNDIALGTLGSRPPFDGLNVVLNGIDPDYRITLQAEKVTRRQALWQLANQYGLALTVGTTGQGATPFVVISNRETRREIRPIP